MLLGLGYLVQASHFWAHQRVHLGTASLPPLVATLQDARLLLHGARDVNTRRRAVSGGGGGGEWWACCGAAERCGEAKAAAWPRASRQAVGRNARLGVR